MLISDWFFHTRTENMCNRQQLASRTKNRRLTLENECKFMQYFDSSHPKKLMRYSAHFKVMSMDFDSYEPSFQLSLSYIATAAVAFSAKAEAKS